MQLWPLCSHAFGGQEPFDLHACNEGLQPCHADLLFTRAEQILANPVPLSISMPLGCPSIQDIVQLCNPGCMYFLRGARTKATFELGVLSAVATSPSCETLLRLAQFPKYVLSTIGGV